ncbi:hypothetical protein ACVDFE_02005 [Lentzea chajnantorensis]
MNCKRPDAAVRWRRVTTTASGEQFPPSSCCASFRQLAQGTPYRTPARQGVPPKLAWRDTNSGRRSVVLMRQAYGAVPCALPLDAAPRPTNRTATGRGSR